MAALRQLCLRPGDHGKILRIVCAGLLMAFGVSGFQTVLAAPGYDHVAAFSDTAAAQEIGKYGMTPIYGQDVEDGTYVIETDCTSPFFRILEAKLTVEDGRMNAVLTMSSKSYLFVYMGTAQEAAEAPFEDYIPLDETDGRQTFSVPVEALNAPVECAAYSRSREKWYGRQILFDAGSLPPGAVRFPVPDYSRIEKAIRLYDREKGTDTKAELYSLYARDEAQTEQSGAGQDGTTGKENGEGPQPVSMEEEDGEYSIEVDLSGGSGRASVTSPTWLYVKDGKGYAKLLWSSVYYDYMIVDGELFLNETTDGSNSTFTIPITALDTPMQVIADTTAMGDPVEIEYALTFYADTVGGKGRVPLEATKQVIVVALFIMVAGGIANHFVKKRRR